MWNIELTDEQATKLQRLIHCGLKHVAMTEGMAAIIEATKAAEEILSLPKKVEAEQE